MNGQYRIDSMWAFTCVDADGTEGVCAAMIGDLGLVALVGADLARIDSIRPYAQAVATQTRRPVVLSHFSVRTDQETIQP